MRKKKKRNSKVRTFPGDRKPAKTVSKRKMFYETKLSKWQGKMRWLVIERPTGSIISTTHFEDEAKRLCDFQNKHKQWVPQGGVVKHLTMGKI